MTVKSSDVSFVSVSKMIELMHTLGTENMLLTLAEYIEQDYKRWTEFDKSPRFAAHSAEGVIELMPTSDARSFSFKYVNGHPKIPVMAYKRLQRLAY